MASSIKSLGEASRHHMLIKAECACGNVKHYRASDLMMQYGGGRDPFALKFKCTSCKPLPFKISLVEVHLDRPPKVMIWKPFKFDGKTQWMPERFK